jgi:hypothetical protein
MPEYRQVAWICASHQYKSFGQTRQGLFAGCLGRYGLAAWQTMGGILYFFIRCGISGKAEKREGKKEGDKMPLYNCSPIRRVRNQNTAYHPSGWITYLCRIQAFSKENWVYLIKSIGSGKSRRVAVSEDSEGNSLLCFTENYLRSGRSVIGRMYLNYQTI